MQRSSGGGGDLVSGQRAGPWLPLLLTAQFHDLRTGSSDGIIRVWCVGIVDQFSQVRPWPHGCNQSNLCSALKY